MSVGCSRDLADSSHGAEQGDQAQIVFRAYERFWRHVGYKHQSSRQWGLQLALVAEWVLNALEGLGR